MDTMDELWTSEQEENLIKLGERLSERYRSADPFPHAVIDDFLPAEIVESALAAFPDRRGLAWEKFSGDNEEKMAFFTAERLAKPLRQLGLSSPSASDRRVIARFNACFHSAPLWALSLPSGAPTLAIIVMFLNPLIYKLLIQ